MRSGKFLESGSDLATYAGDAQVGRALRAGAAGYLLKSTLHRELLQGCCQVIR